MPALAENRLSLVSGELVGRYRIGAPLGAGGAGAVYAARVEGDPREYAVKVLLPQWASNAVMVERFRREVATLCALEHPNVIRVLDFGQRPDGSLWYAMPRLRGVDLDVLLRRHGRLDAQDAIRMMEAVCAALEAAHAIDVIHRDLKASNVFVGDEEPPTITLFDFGAARVDPSTQGQGLTAAGTAVGTPTSMAPEQVVGLELDARTDIYAAGVLLFRMLTGRYPFDAGTPEEIMMDQLVKPPPRPSELAAIPAALERIVLRCLEKRAEDRYGSAAQLRAALQELGPARSSGRLRAPVLAIHVELTAEESILDAFGLDALERSAERLADAGYDLALGVGGSVLGIAPLLGDPKRAVTLANALAAELRDELIAEVHREIDPRVVIHLRDASDGAELHDFEDAALPVGVHLTPAVLALLGEPTTRP